MKFTVSSVNLQSAIVKASGAVEKEDSMTPILSNFLIRAKNGQAIIIGTNLELGFIGIMEDADIEVEGEVTIPADKLIAIAPQADSANVTFETNESTCYITSDDAVWTLCGIESSQFPDVPDFNDEDNITIDRVAFYAALNRVSYAICDDQTRANLMQVYINNNMMIATDGHRLSFVEFPWEEDEMTIPAPAVPELVKIMRFSKGDAVHIIMGESLILFKIDDNVFSTRVSVGRFPEVVERVLKPSENNTNTITVSRKSLVSAIRKVKITSSEENLVTISVMDGKISVKAKDATGSNCQALVTALVNSSVPEFDINLNWQYLLDVLGIINEDDVTIRCGDPNAPRVPPVRIDSLNGTNKNILMQLRV